jgi:nucleotide-binding universal stress UspA family protein
LYQHILIGYDGSPPSIKAFETALAMARRDSAELTVLTVAEVLEIGSDVEGEAAIERSKRHHQHLLHAVQAKCAAMARKPTFELVVGHAALHILELAQQRHVDLIVLGHRGRGALDRWVIGSVAHRVISYAHCAVLVVR